MSAGRLFPSFTASSFSPVLPMATVLLSQYTSQSLILCSSVYICHWQTFALKNPWQIFFPPSFTPLILCIGWILLHMTPCLFLNCGFWTVGKVCTCIPVFVTLYYTKTVTEKRENVFVVSDVSQLVISTTKIAVWIRLPCTHLIASC